MRRTQKRHLFHGLCFQLASRTWPLGSPKTLLKRIPITIIYPNLTRHKGNLSNIAQYTQGLPIQPRVHVLDIDQYTQGLDCWQDLASLRTRGQRARVWGQGGNNHGQ